MAAQIIELKKVSKCFHCGYEHKKGDTVTYYPDSKSIYCNDNKHLNIHPGGTVEYYLARLDAKMGIALDRLLKGAAPTATTRTDNDDIPF